MVNNMTTATTMMNRKVDTSLLSVNRSKLMKLAEGIKTKKKSSGQNKKSALNFKKDPGYTNIEHLVFGTYRSRGSPSPVSPLPTKTATALVAGTNECFNNGEQHLVVTVGDENSELQWASLPVHLNSQNVDVTEQMRNSETICHGNGFEDDFDVRRSSKFTPTMTSSSADTSNSIHELDCKRMSWPADDVPDVCNGYLNGVNNGMIITNAGQPAEVIKMLEQQLTSNAKSQSAGCSNGRSKVNVKHNNHNKPTGCCSTITTTKSSSPESDSKPPESDLATSCFTTQDIDPSATLLSKSESCGDVAYKDSTSKKFNGIDPIDLRGKSIMRIPSKAVQRQSARGVPTSRGLNSENNRLTYSFNHGGRGDSRPNSGIIQATSVQSICKISVSASNPARPTLSTNVKLTVTSDGVKVPATTRSVGDSTIKNARIPEARNSFCSPRIVSNSNRNSLLVTNKAMGSNGRMNVTRTDRPRMAPASGGNLVELQSRSSSISSLSSRKHPGSTSSLECSGHQNMSPSSSSKASPCSQRPTSAKSETSAAGIGARRSFHAGSYQRSISTRDSILKTMAPSTRSPNSIPKQVGRMSLRLPISNGRQRPNTACPTKSMAPHPGPSVTKNKTSRIPQYKFPPKNNQKETFNMSNDSITINNESRETETEIKFDSPLDGCSDTFVTSKPSVIIEDDVLALMTTSEVMPKSDECTVKVPLPNDFHLGRQRNSWRPPLPTRSLSLAARETSRPLDRGRRLSELSVTQPTPSDESTQQFNQVTNDEDSIDTTIAVDGGQDGEIDVVVVNGDDEESSSRNAVIIDSGEQCAEEEEAKEPTETISRCGHARTVPKCLRRLKAASSPVFAETRVDSWVSEGDLRRPWSQICTEQDVECLMQEQCPRSKGTLMGSGSMTVGIEGIANNTPISDSILTGQGPSHQANVVSRFSSMRQHPNTIVHPTSTVEGVLQKFRKSFSARFYKKVKAADSPTSVSKSCRHASFSSYLTDGTQSPLENSGEVDSNSGEVDSNSTVGCVNSVNGLTNASDVSGTDSSDGGNGDTGGGGCGGGGGGGGSGGGVVGGNGETVFRLGPIVWRSSKERREKFKKSKNGNFVLKDSTAISTPDLNGLTESCNRLHTYNDDSSSCCPSKQLSASTTPLPTTGARPSPVHCAACRSDNYNHSTGVSPQVLRRRAPISTSLRFERQKRPLSDQSSLHGSIIMPNTFELTQNGERMHNKTDGDVHFCPLRSRGIDRALYSSTNEIGGGLPPLVIVRRQKKMPLLRWSKGRTNLRRSVSQPLEMEKLEALNTVSVSKNPGGLSDKEDNGPYDLSMASSEEEIGSDVENNGKANESSAIKNCRHCAEYSEPVVYAEALWDHVTMDAEELAFKAGNLVEILDDSDPEWWWGVIGNKAGWFPAPFVRRRVNQEDTVEDCEAKMNNGTLCSKSNRGMSVSLLSNDQVRTNVIMEIVSTEKDFVRHLKDVCEGYLKQVRKRPDMFSDDAVSTIFGNIEQLYTFQSDFVSKLEQCINWEEPHLSQIGSCFTDNREGFEIYSEYCNNHSQALSELQELYTNTKYAHFFEACRLLQDMIDISLDGFLLTPVQKICKYPLQLAELLKYTRSDHPDYDHVAKALDAMRSVAQYINERKRRMECLEKLAAWQITLEYWEGPDLLETSSELIYSGEVSKVTAAWSRDFTFFLFDHQIIICRKDLLKRNSYSYKSRIDMDRCEVIDIPDGRDASTGLFLKNGWKMYCSERAKWLVFATKTADEKQRWMKAFESERRRVDEDKRQGFVITEKAKKTATMVVLTRKNPKRPKDKENKFMNGRRSGRSNDRYVLSSKSGSLPSNLLLSTNANKKKTNATSNSTSSSSSSGWFHFGSNKKSKRT